MADYNIPRMPKHYGTLKMPEHDVERELTLLRQNWKDLPISAVVSEYGYACHAQRLADIGTGKTPCLVDCRTPRTMKRKTFRPEVDIKRRPKSAGARRPKTPQRPATRDGRRAIESGTRDLSAETKEILRGGYTLDDKQKEVYDQFTEMLADFDLYMMVNTCVEIKILRRVRAESSRRPPRHRRDTCSMAWRCRFLTARRNQRGHVIAENAPDTLVDFHTGRGELAPGRKYYGVEAARRVPEVRRP